MEPFNERRKNPYCLHHYGLEEQIKALCRKISDLEKIINIHMNHQKEAIAIAKVEMERRMDSFKDMINPISDRVKLLEKSEAREEGSLTWKNHIITVGISLSIFLLGHWILKF